MESRRTELEGVAPAPWYPAICACKIAIVTALFVLLRGPIRDIVPAPRVLLPSLAVGVVVFVAWVGLDRWVPYPHFAHLTMHEVMRSKVAELAAKLL